jgi:hypothetical protein
VDERVVRDVVSPGIELARGGQLAVDEQVGHLEVAGLLGELLDGIAPVAQDAVLTVELGDGARCGRGGHQGGVVEPDPRQQLAPLGGVNASVEDRHLDRLATAVVGDRDALSHVLGG